MNFSFYNDIILENAFVLLRPICNADIENLLTIATKHKDLLQFSPSPIYSKELLKAYVDKAIENRQNNIRYTFCVFDKTKNLYAGSTSFLNISNADDRRGAVMLQNTSAKKYFYSLKTMADFKGKILENSLTGLLMTINDIEVHFKLIGTFNAYNILAVYGAAICLGEDKQTVLQVLSSLSGAEGRFDYMVSQKDKVIGIVDYAHTPDALLNVLATIKNLRQGEERILTVVGCGGDRDKTKRPVMAEVVCEHSDKIFFTSLIFPLSISSVASSIISLFTSEKLFTKFSGF